MKGRLKPALFFTKESSIKVLLSAVWILSEPQSSESECVLLMGPANRWLLHGRPETGVLLIAVKR